MILISQDEFVSLRRDISLDDREGDNTSKHPIKYGINSPSCTVRCLLSFNHLNRKTSPHPMRLEAC